MFGTKPITGEDFEQHFDKDVWLKINNLDFCVSESDKKRLFGKEHRLIKGRFFNQSENRSVNGYRVKSFIFDIDKDDPYCKELMNIVVNNKMVEVRVYDIVDTEELETIIF